MAPTRDNVPAVHPAGRSVHPDRVGTVADCMEELTPPPTPEHLQPFRKSYTQGVGKSMPSSPARARDPPHPEGKVFGAVTKNSMTTEECLQSPRERVNPAGRVHVYQSEKLEPLGGRRQYSFDLPEDTLSRRFGKVGNKSESAKNVMYPLIGGDEVPNPKQEVGFQKERGYDWTGKGINPQVHRFGKASSPNKTNVIAMAGSGEALIPSPTKNARELHHSPMGSPHRRGYAPPEAFEPGKVFGKTAEAKADSAGSLMRGGGSGDSPELGAFHYDSPQLRRLKESDRESLDSERTFGVPSVRTDRPIPPAHKLKVTNGTAFVGDLDAGDLLYGGESSSVTRQGLTLEECRSLGERCHFGLSPEQAREAYRRAQKNSSPKKGVIGGAVAVTAPAFAQAVTECGF